MIDPEQLKDGVLLRMSEEFLFKKHEYPNVWYVGGDGVLLVVNVKNSYLCDCLTPKGQIVTLSTYFLLANFEIKDNA